MKKTNQTYLTIAIIVIVIIGIVLFYKPASEETIKVGASLPLTGPIAKFGEWETNGIQMAVDEINNAGGIKGKMMEVIIEDDKGFPGEAQKTMTKLYTLDKVDYLIGGTTATAPVAPSIIKDKLIFISAFNPESVEEYENVFSLMPSFSEEARTLAEYIYNSGVKKISIFYVNNYLGVTYKNKFNEEFSKLGGKILAVETFGLTDTDYRTSLTKIKSKNAEATLVVMSGGGLGNILKQALEMGLEGEFFGQTITESPVFLDVAGDLANGMVYTYPFKLENLGSSFLADYKERYGNVPEMYSTSAYNAVYTIANAVEKCGNSCSSQDIMILSFDGAAGNVNFGEDRNLVGEFYLKEVVDGSFSFM